MAGAGTGSTPCSVLTVPLPTLRGEQKMASTSSEFEGQARADDIGDGIGRADFVKMDFFDGHLVNFGFGLAEPAETRRWRSVCTRSGSDGVLRSS